VVAKAIQEVYTYAVLAVVVRCGWCNSFILEEASPPPPPPPAVGERVTVLRLDERLVTLGKKNMHL
jgi:hypothetical protein